MIDESQKRILIDDKEFIVGVQLKQLQDAGLDLPLRAAKVTQNDWKKL